VKIKNTKKLRTCQSKDYNFIFNKTNGSFARWGNTLEDDPQVAPMNEILDCEITTICHGVPNKDGVKTPCEFCSPKGTKINTPNGLKKIELIRNNDLVIGFNILNSTIEIQKVQKTYKRKYNGDLICIELENGEILKLTPEHIIILKNEVEKQAKDLKEDDEIIYF
jgi:hypothetical protein